MRQTCRQHPSALGGAVVNRHGETGLTVPPGDVDALRRALAELASDAGLGARFGSAGRRRVETEFTMEIMRRSAAAAYREAAAG